MLRITNIKIEGSDYVADLVDQAEGLTFGELCQMISAAAHTDAEDTTEDLAEAI